MHSRGGHGVMSCCSKTASRTEVGTPKLHQGSGNYLCLLPDKCQSLLACVDWIIVHKLQEIIAAGMTLLLAQVHPESHDEKQKQIFVFRQHELLT